VKATECSLLARLSRSETQSLRYVALSSLVELGGAVRSAGLCSASARRLALLWIEVEAERIACPAILAADSDGRRASLHFHASRAESHLLG
jgi:hypothetical protein